MELIDLVELGGEKQFVLLLVIFVPVLAGCASFEFLLESAVVDVVCLPCGIEVVLGCDGCCCCSLVAGVTIGLDVPAYLDSPTELHGRRRREELERGKFD